MTVRSLAANISEAQIHTEGVAGRLGGIMLRPFGRPAPGIVIIPGSGPIDCDGNSPLGVSAGLYRLLAEGLAASGITVLRIDKRGMFSSLDQTTQAEEARLADYATDVASWTAYLEAQCVAPVWLLGHSEGALVALLAASRGLSIGGLILLAAPGRPLNVILREQLRTAIGEPEILMRANAVIDTLEHGGFVNPSDVPPALEAIFQPQAQAFLIDAFRYDPVEMIRELIAPVLVAQGLRDLQVTEQDANLLAMAAPHAKLLLLPGATHVFKTAASDDLDANVATYTDPSLRLSDGLVDAIAEFVLMNPIVA